MIRLSATRVLFVLIVAACVGLMGYGLYLQHVGGLEPCPMCILQRYAFIMIGVSALIAAIHHPAAFGTKVYAVVMAIFTLLGGGVAARQTWLHYFPNPSQGCAADLSYLLELPMSRAWPAIFRGTAECTDVPWRFLGLSIPEWSLISFAGFLAAAIFIFVRARR